jgi:hypothetical protein
MSQCEFLLARVKQSLIAVELAACFEPTNAMVFTPSQLSALHAYQRRVFFLEPTSDVITRLWHIHPEVDSWEWAA